MGGARIGGKMEAVLEEHIASGNYYEAHQVLKSQVARKKSRKKYKEAAAMAAKGCKLLLENGQSDSATDLGKQMLDLYAEAGINESDASLATVLDICSSFPSDASAVTARTTLIKAAIKWSTKTGEYSHGNPKLHNMAAASFAQHGMYEKAQAHFLRGDEPTAFSEMLSQWSAQGYASEQDLFLARAVLGYIVLKNLRDANTVYECTLRTVREQTPMHNFLKFLLLVLERDAAPLFQDLRKRYAPTIDRDPSLNMFLDAIGQTFYNIRPAQSGLAGMMGEMMKSFMAPQ